MFTWKGGIIADCAACIACGSTVQALSRAQCLPSHICFDKTFVILTVRISLATSDLPAPLMCASVVSPVCSLLFPLNP